MGSLMPGWKSKSDIYKRNHSLTNEEIEAFWRSNKKPNEKQHIIDGDTIICEEKAATVSKSGKKFEKSSSMPLARTKLEQDQKYFMHGETETMASTTDKLVDNNGWWTRSNWAFLNEPPPSEGASKTSYASQFHVASSSGGVDGIST
ncbi:hypothetical protein RchiOBHm_Chr6g0301271 [Rosa chinensis]|uniref:Uncharacterized protein n=1 Tax=Rosa chinensis TaxID=74649 RepID=A0A2P6PYN9_ROSCH|nr:uncharacterized protein LOC112174689 [Rosa chinensis]PRQ27057.1 hypothetical protein RchiOBHm_Chr6g0301271 [Rosa chinensis]